LLGEIAESNKNRGDDRHDELAALRGAHEK
jgi:hypothetical protein